MEIKIDGKTRFENLVTKTIIPFALVGYEVIITCHRARKIFEFHLAHWASNPQILLAQGTSPLAQVFKLINNS